MKNGKVGDPKGRTTTTLRKASDVSESETKKSQTNRPDTVVSGTSNSSDKTKKTTKTEKTDKSDSSDGKTEKTVNEDKTSKSGDSDNETENKTSISPTNKALTTKKSTVKDYQPKKDATIRFEDEAYKAEKHHKLLDANLFIGYLTEFFEEEQDILMPPPDYNDESKLMNNYIV